MVDGARCMQDPALEQETSERLQPAAQADPVLTLSRSMGNAAFGSAIAGGAAVPGGAVHGDLAGIGAPRRMARTSRLSPRAARTADDAPLTRGLARAARERRRTAAFPERSLA